MALYGVNTLKRSSFRGGTQHFGNTYYYGGGIPNTDTPQLEDMLDQIVAIEKEIFTTDVEFVAGRVWSADGPTKADNVMLVDKPLSGTGAVTPIPSMDKERAWLIQFRAGIDSRGRPVYLRKWFHLWGSYGGISTTAGQQANTEPLTAAQRQALADIGTRLSELLVSSTPMTLQAKSTRRIDGDISCHPFIEHRQLGEEWRGG